MKVRKATRYDAEQLLRLIEQKAEFDRTMKGFNGEVTTTLDKMERTIFSNHPIAHVLLLESNEEIIGFALYHYRYSSFSGDPSVWLDDLLIVGNQRSKGGGTQLMHAVKMEAESAVASHISWTASPTNIKAHEFYIKIGAEIERMEGKRPYFRWECSVSC